MTRDSGHVSRTEDGKLYFCDWFEFKLLANIFVASYTACGDHVSGLVMNRISSQFRNDGIILNGFGSLPDLYLDNNSPTL